MEVVENTLEATLDAFLDRPSFCVLARKSRPGPRVSPLWFLWEEGAVWIIALEGRSYTDRAREYPRSALAAVDFDPRTGRVEHVGMRGTASVEPWDPCRARAPWSGSSDRTASRETGALSTARIGRSSGSTPTPSWPATSPTGRASTGLRRGSSARGRSRRPGSARGVRRTRGHSPHTGTASPAGPRCPPGR